MRDIEDQILTAASNTTADAVMLAGYTDTPTQAAPLMEGVALRLGFTISSRASRSSSKTGHSMGAVILRRPCGPRPGRGEDGHLRCPRTHLSCWLVLQFAVVEVPFLQAAFGTASLDLAHWAVATAMASVVDSPAHDALSADNINPDRSSSDRAGG